MYKYNIVEFTYMYMYTQCTCGFLIRWGCFFESCVHVYSILQSSTVHVLYVQMYMYMYIAIETLRLIYMYSAYMYILIAVHVCVW